MSNKLNRVEIGPNFFFNSIIDKRYKSNRISVNLFVPLEESTATEYALLSGVLGKSTKKYPQLMMVNRKLEELYGASLSSDILKIGELQSVSVHMTFIGNKYALYGENILQESINFLCEVLLNPNVENGAFLSSEVEIEKVRLAELIDSEINNKRGYAISQCSKIMCKGERFAIPRYGDKESLNKITPEGLYHAYKTLLSKARIEIFYVGSDPAKLVLDGLREPLLAINRQPLSEINTSIYPQVPQVKRVDETMDIQQAKLVMGFKAGDAKSVEDNTAMMMAMMIFGMSPSSKLFVNVREKLQLCYYCDARYDKYKCLLFVDSGIEFANRQLAEDEILKQLSAVQQGDFTSKDLQTALMYFQNSYRFVFDAPRMVEAYYLGQVMSDAVKDPDEMIDIASNVTKEHIMKICQDIKLDTVYCLSGTEV